jgi:hypothetical protein
VVIVVMIVVAVAIRDGPYYAEGLHDSAFAHFIGRGWHAEIPEQAQAEQGKMLKKQHLFGSEWLV